MPSVKKNFIWSTILTVAGYLFPLITFPYVTRVLGVEGLGNYQFAYSTIEYFSIFAMLGMGVIGIREVAKEKGDRAKLSQTFSSLVVINLITAFLAICVLLVLTFIIPSFIAHGKMLYIGMARILCNVLLIEWLFKGLEDFRFITVRAILVRCVYVASVFLFVKDENDYVIYFLLSTLAVVVNSFINLVYSKRFVDFSFRNLNLQQYVKPFIILGAYRILTAMYTSFNVIYLGSQCGDIEVGYYGTATRLYTLIMSVFTAFTGVMMPRMSSLLAEGKTDDFKNMTVKSIDCLLLFCLPLIVLFEVYTPQIIRIIAGDGYDGAVLPMRIVVPLMLVIGYEQIIIIQMLMPLKKDNAIFINSCVGAGVGLLLNIILVPILASVGSTIVWCASEVTVLVIAQRFVTKYTGYKMPIKKILFAIVAYLPAIVICLLFNRLFSNWIISLLVGGVFVGVYCFVVEYFILKNKIMQANIESVTGVFQKRLLSK